MTDPLVSIIAVTYGHTQWQIECFITSILAQTDPRWVLYVIHDGPNSEVREIVERFSRLDSRVIYLESEQRNGKWGHPNRLKVLYEYVKTKYCNHNNVDNLIAPKYIESLLSQVENNPNVDIAAISIVHSYAGSDNYCTPFQVLDPLPCLNRIDFCNYIIKTELAKKHGLDVDFTGADGLLVQWAMSDGATFSKLPLVLAYHL